MIMENFKEELAAALDHGWPLGAEQGEYRRDVEAYLSDPERAAKFRRMVNSHMRRTSVDLYDAIYHCIPLLDPLIWDLKYRGILK